MRVDSSFTTFWTGPFPIVSFLFYQVLTENPVFNTSDLCLHCMPMHFFLCKKRWGAWHSWIKVEICYIKMQQQKKNSLMSYAKRESQDHPVHPTGRIYAV